MIFAFEGESNHKSYRNLDFIFYDNKDNEFYFEKYLQKESREWFYMDNSLTSIERVLNGDLSVLKKERWLFYLYLTRENRISIERLKTLEELKENSVFNYVIKCIKRLYTMNIPEYQKHIVEEVLKWKEVSKCGMPHIRNEWVKKGYNLFVHNIGSSEIYTSEQSLTEADIKLVEEKHIINTLILTHGLLGQYIRGEVNLSENVLITNLILRNYIDKETLRSILFILNECIIAGVSEEIWHKTREDVAEAVEIIVSNKYHQEYSVKERIRRLRLTTIEQGEDFETEYLRIIKNNDIEEIFKHIFANTYLWYVEAALSEFSFEEFTKIFLITYKKCNALSVKHISFEKMMKALYYDYQGKKAVNLYKQRIIEKYLSAVTIADIINNNIPQYEHVNCVVSLTGIDTVSVYFEFSPAGNKLIEFCQEAEKSVVYEKGIIMLYDLFGFRRDQYDRFHNEETYMETMNKSVNFKAKILDYVVGKNIIDIGPGGGALMDLLSERFTEANVLGADIATNEVEALLKKKHKYNKTWNVIKADAVNIDQYKTEIEKYFKDEPVETFIYSSVIHHIYTFNEIDGGCFKHESIGLALKNAFSLLKPGGRIIIRDGIMSEPEDQYRIIKFKIPKEIEILDSYCDKFKGREVSYEKLSEDSVKMLINDAMEFLYTYTWGPDSFNHEVKEQFGYFTPSGYKNFIKETLGEEANIILWENYLQDGYSENLLTKIDFYDEALNEVQLPDSTCFCVIEKSNRG